MRGKYLLLLLLFVLPLSGCQLAEQESASEDRLIGVYLTKEYVDTMNVEAYLNDHMGEPADGKTLQVEEGAAQAYQERIYAVDVSQDPKQPAYQFPDLEGVPIYCFSVDDPQGEESYWIASDAPEVQVYRDYTAGDGMDEMVLTADLYVPVEAIQEFYANPMCRTPDGQVYLIGGTGVSGRMDTAGTSLGKTIAETVTLTTDGETIQQRYEFKINMTAVLPMERIVLLELDANSQVIERMEFLPGQVPDTFAPAAETAYLVVETHRASISGEEKVDRALFDRQDSAFSTYVEGENGFFCRTDTSLAWTDGVREPM